MRFTVSTKPEQQRLNILLINEEIADFQELVKIMYRLSHRAGFKKEIGSNLVDLVDAFHTKFDYGDNKPNVTNHTSTQIEVPTDE